MFAKLLIANRGEIACRIIRSCRRLGIATVAVYSDADADALHVRSADQAVHIGASPPGESYLRPEKIIAAARSSGAQAIHPGYGFLSENPGFARDVREAGLTFVGPEPESVERMGSKADAKALMQAAGVPVVPGYHGAEQSAEFLRQKASEVGFPLMIKAAAGGGGKGMRIVRSDSEFDAALASACRESQSAFGDQRMILERYVETPRHIEFQVFGDKHGNIIHLGERECSAQRRYQKVLEETPSPFLDDARRNEMGAAAVAAARAVDYVGAGTVEFIVAADGSFFFMEMNTRLQVEHPVTEQVTGIDLVEWQLRVAAGEPLPLSQQDIHSHGHSIELRLYAEDPARGFLPGSGRLQRLILPAASAHVRVDAGVEQGDTVSVFYDPMIAKLIVHDLTRDAALSRMREALALTYVQGPASNIGFLQALIDHPVVRNAEIHTGYLDQHLDDFLPAAQTPDPDLLIAAACRLLLDQEQPAARPERSGAEAHSPWSHADAWRLGHPGRRVVVLQQGDDRIEISAHGSLGHYQLDWTEQSVCVEYVRLDGDRLSVRLAERSFSASVRHHGKHLLVEAHAQRSRFETVPAYAFEGEQGASSGKIVAPMPGRIVSVRINDSDQVEAGQELLVMEAMKMEITLRAPHAGTVSALRAREGEFVEADALLVTVDAADEPA